MYGLPRYDEIDPTSFLTVSFPIFFGIALSDAGYGLALAAFMLSGVWIAKAFPPYLRKMMALCGITTVVVSLFIGGWFGFGEGLWTKPTEQPIPLLKLAIFIGIAHLVIALGLAGILKDLRRRDRKRVVFERIPRTMILLGFFGLVFSILGVGLHEFGIAYRFPRMELFTAFNPLAQAPAVVQAFRALFYGGLILGATGAVLTAKGLRERIGGPINVVYGITGLVADVTSYTRLLALGIATGVVAFSINLIISIFWGWLVAPNLSLSPALILGVVSAVALAFLFVVAHAFNIFINTLGGFIHTMRLHFAEFFGKFYEGGGERFTPFKAKRRLTVVRGGRKLAG
jgi:V/A-type H+-transporting ATPase subunit I